MPSSLFILKLTASKVESRLSSIISVTYYLDEATTLKIAWRTCAPFSSISVKCLARPLLFPWRFQVLDSFARFGKRFSLARTPSTRSTNLTLFSRAVLRAAAINIIPVGASRGGDADFSAARITTRFESPYFLQ